MRSVDRPNDILSDRLFGSVIGFIFLGLFGVCWLFAGVFSPWLLLTGTVFLLFALIKPGILMPFNRIWQYVAHRLGIVTNRIVLGLVFFGAFWPIATVLRLIGYDPMARSPSPRIATYFTTVSRKENVETYSDQF